MKQGGRREMKELTDMLLEAEQELEELGRVGEEDLRETDESGEQ